MDTLGSCLYSSMHLYNCHLALFIVIAYIYKHHFSLLYYYTQYIYRIVIIVVIIVQPAPMLKYQCSILISYLIFVHMHRGFNRSVSVFALEASFVDLFFSFCFFFAFFVFIFTLVLSLNSQSLLHQLVNADVH